MTVAINWAELITHRALDGLLSATIMLDGELMRNFSITVKRMRACWWWRATHSSLLILFMPLSTHTQLSQPLCFLQRLTFPSHTSTVLCSVLHSVDQGSCLAYKPPQLKVKDPHSLPLSATLAPGSILSRERGRKKGWNTASYHLQKLQRKSASDFSAFQKQLFILFIFLNIF